MSTRKFANNMHKNHEKEQVAPGIWRLHIGGESERFTPVAVMEPQPRREALEALPCGDASALPTEVIAWKSMPRGLVLSYPLAKGEMVYGFGLQFKSVNQRGKKKQLRVNSDPVADTGDSHAPVPFFVTTQGYGVFVDTARYASFYCGSAALVNDDDLVHVPSACDGQVKDTREILVGLYQSSENQSDGVLVVDIPIAKGVDIYIFEGPDMRTAVQRYVLFSGGGVLPTFQALGVWYRPNHKGTREEILDIMRGMRDDNMPCDILGLEPSWLSHAYSCTYQWDKNQFPDPDAFIREAKALGFTLSLWEHIFIHPDAPFYEKLKPMSGDFQVFGGLVPDLSLDEAADTYACYHETEFIEKGIRGFKLDECDSSDFTGHWSYPNCAQFPSGMDGEEMHMLMGLLYQRAVHCAFQKANVRHLSQVRSSGGLGAGLPFVLYSDWYDHMDYIRGVVNMGFSGILWCPEIREAKTEEDLLRRIQLLTFAPITQVNVFAMPHPIWKQYDFQLNHQGIFRDENEDVTRKCRDVFNLRMALIPYVYAAYVRYWLEGFPPFRALVMDHPQDPNTHAIDDQFMMGEDLLVAPLLAGQAERKVYLPKGNWYDFYTNQRYEGEQWIMHRSSLETFPVFVREGALLPMAEPMVFVPEDVVFQVTMVKYGKVDGDTRLYSDDGITYNYENGEYAVETICWAKDGDPALIREGKYAVSRYEIQGYTCIE